MWVGDGRVVDLFSVSRSRVLATPIDVQKARGPLARHEAWLFSLTLAQPDMNICGPGPSLTRRLCRP